MNATLALMLFSLVILLYWVISELFAVLFRFAGLPEEKALPLALSAVDHGLSVRQLEKLAAAASREEKPAAPAKSSGRALYAKQLGEALSGRLGRKVQLHVGAKKGRLEIEYYDNADLASLLDQLGIPVEL